MERNKKCLKKWPFRRDQAHEGFSLIELLVVVAIISLLTSVALIAVQSAREKSRNVKRLADMTQLNTALELYFSYNRGYPQGTAGQPLPLTPQFVIKIPIAPQPEDGVCDGLSHNAEVTADNGGTAVPANEYYYLSGGTPTIIDSATVYPSYTYYFCIGSPTGIFSPGERFLTPEGLR